MEKHKKTPILAVTAHSVKEYLDQCIDAGMDDYLTKPMRKQDILAKIAKWVPGAKTMDFERAVSEFGGDPEFLRNLTAEFINAAGKQIAGMREAFPAQDWDRIRKDAHAIKGAAANLTATSLAEAAAGVETACADKVMNRDILYRLEHEFRVFHDFCREKVL
jgi:HPt (histidine-containing phosphotransfer) domain-containing protein